MKICSKCKVEKSLSEFNNRKAAKDGKRSYCKECQKVLMSNWRSKNKEHEKEYRNINHEHLLNKRRENNGWEPQKYVLRNDTGQECCTCNEFKKWDSFRNWKNGPNGKARSCNDCAKASGRKRRLIKGDEMRAKEASYRLENKKELTNYYNEWKKENADRVKAYMEARKPKTRAENKARYKEKYGIDDMFTAKIRVRSSIKNAFANRGYPKTSKTTDLLGCSFETVKQHLESQFTEGMSWDNHGEWHIDHKLPLAIADTVADLEILSYYKNLQPLWAIDNLKKNASVPWE